MTDIVDKKKRFAIMSGIRSKNTNPELIVRSIAHKLGLRYRLHRVELQGRPDMVLPKYKTVIFIHGCFWHRHRGCKMSYTPKSNQSFWNEKFSKNIARDTRNEADLRSQGWRVLKIWECETKDPLYIGRRLEEIFRLRHF